MGAAGITMQVHMSMLDPGAKGVDQQLQTKAEHDKEAHLFNTAKFKRLRQQMHDGKRKKIGRTESQ